MTSVGNSALLSRPSAWKKKYAHRGVSELAAVAATGRREQLIEAAGDDLLLHKHLLSEALRKKPEARPRFGYLRIWVLLHEGWSVIASASAACCRLVGFSSGCEFDAETYCVASVARPDPDRSSERWSMDFVHAILADRRPFRILTVVDN